MLSSRKKGLLAACVLFVFEVAFADYYKPDFFPIGLTGINTTEQDGSNNCPYGILGWTWDDPQSSKREDSLIFDLGVNCIGGQDANARYIGSFDTTVVMIQAKMDKESGFECIVRIESSHVCLPYYKLSCGLKSSVSSLPC
jgi:hypothetical protein